MTLSDRLKCPDCQGRLTSASAGRVTSASAGQLVCDGCDRRFAVEDRIVDLTGPVGPGHYDGVAAEHGLLATGLAGRIKAAAGTLWPSSLGDTIEIGCGLGSITRAILTQETVRSLLAVDSDLAMLRACRTAVADFAADPPVLFVAPGDGLATIRDAVADTVIGTTVLSGIGDLRAFLTRVHQILRTKGRAMFVVPNRRYHLAACLGMAEALTQRYGRDGRWPDACTPVLGLLGDTRRRMLQQGDPAVPGQLRLFDSDALADICHEVGFEPAAVLPLDPDPAGGQTLTRLCQDAGATQPFAQEFGSLAATVGRPYLGLLAQQDASAFSLMWVTKAAGPTVRVFTDRPSGPPMVYVGPDAAVGGLMPRWSVELLGRDTPDGVVVAVGGWCLANMDVTWVKITLGTVSRETPVWRPRPDVHEVMNRSRIYHPWHALCSGIGDDLRFPGVHPDEQGCKLHVEIMLTGGLVVTGPIPEWLVMNQPVVISH
jgi:SAM-dependent methyltransferase